MDKLKRRVRIGIDATNLNVGGGRTHILNLIKSIDFIKQIDFEIVLYANDDLLSKLPNYDWLEKKSNTLINRSILHRYIWYFIYSKEEFQKNCDILFAPSGLYFGSFKPFVSMSRNMMLFDRSQMIKQKGLLRLKLYLSRMMNIRSMNKAEGVIFISDFAKETISKELSLDPSKITKISHGISENFKLLPQDRKYNYNSNEIKLLYVSHVYSYKHPWVVAEAVGLLKDKGYNVRLDIIGGGNKIDIDRLNQTISIVDPANVFIKYHGNQPFETIHNFYQNSDVFVYASTCENMPNILLEAMSSSLPIACSMSAPMPEFLKDAGIYFNAVDKMSIFVALESLLNSESLRRSKGQLAFNYANTYSWHRTAEETINFIKKVYNNCAE